MQPLKKCDMYVKFSGAKSVVLAEKPRKGAHKEKEADFPDLFSALDFLIN